MKYKSNKNIKGLVKKNNSFYRVNREITEELFINNEEVLEQSIYVHRIFANIALSLKNEQFFHQNENYQYKLQLFDDEFMSEDNQAISFKMNCYEICKGSNYHHLQESLQFLENFKKQWYTSTNQKGETIKCYGGLISSPVINKKTGNFQFYINSFWLKKLIHLDRFNKTFYNLVQNVSSNKQMLFWYWLIMLPSEGTQINYKKINDRYKLDYKSARSVVKDFLKPIKNKLDLYSHVSFNCSYKGDLIQIAKYERTAEEFSLDNMLSKKQKKSLKKNYKLGYISKRHNLTQFQKGKVSTFLKRESNIFSEAYQAFIAQCRKNKKLKATDYIGEDFILEINKYLKECYLQTPSGKVYPKAFPQI